MTPTWPTELTKDLAANPTREVMEKVAEALERAKAGACDPVKHGAQCRLAEAIRRFTAENDDCEL